MLLCTRCVYISSCVSASFVHFVQEKRELLIMKTFPPQKMRCMELKVSEENVTSYPCRYLLVQKQKHMPLKAKIFPPQRMWCMGFMVCEYIVLLCLFISPLHAMQMCMKTFLPQGTWCMGSKVMSFLTYMCVV